MTADTPVDIIVQQGFAWFGDRDLRIYFNILPGTAKSGDTAENTFTIKADAPIDTTPARITLDASRPGRQYDGLGGNFRLQDPVTDPPVIEYCLDNLNVTWGRVEMPWSAWHPDEHVDPLKAAQSGNLDRRVESAMQMAQQLSRKGMPVIVSAWYPPAWAAKGELFSRNDDGLRGNALNPVKMQSIIRSLTAYLLHLKQAYGVEAVMFSFNESDLGINVRQTGEEHADLIKNLGAFMASKGLATQMLLGDNSDANTYHFIQPAIQDPAAHKYIGALSFHSWRGCDPWTLQIWADAADEMNVPLLVGEGSINAAAHRYPDVFLEPYYALDEIERYIRILSICQAKSILQWQLTSDYSVLTGGGVYGTEGSLRPTQRFWNLKQLGLTPKGSFYLPATCDHPEITCAAFGDIDDGIYSLHIVNDGAERQITVTGLPQSLKSMDIYTTNPDKDMKKGKRIKVKEGMAEFTLEAAGYTALIGSSI
ncbi:MAG: hypothetical protein U5R06_20000 [candidate division KSB1 bacterium]|nr:hypothetical protein [candidate division KSB1 bacterium]